MQMTPKPHPYQSRTRRFFGRCLQLGVVIAIGVGFVRLAAILTPMVTGFRVSQWSRETDLVAAVVPLLMMLVVVLVAYVALSGVLYAVARAFGWAHAAMVLGAMMVPRWRRVCDRAIAFGLLGMISSVGTIASTASRAGAQTIDANNVAVSASEAAYATRASIAPYSAQPSNAPRDSAPASSARTDSAPRDSSQASSAQASNARSDSAQASNAPRDSAPTDSAPTDSAPTDSAPTDSAPTDSAPTDDATMRGTPLPDLVREPEPATPDEMASDGDSNGHTNAAAPTSDSLSREPAAGEPSLDVPPTPASSTPAPVRTGREAPPNSEPNAGSDQLDAVRNAVNGLDALRAQQNERVRGGGAPVAPSTGDGATSGTPERGLTGEPVAEAKGASTSYTVVAGDNFWAIAARQVAGARNVDVHALRPDEIAPYWADLVAANRTVLRSGNPSLIYAGEVFTLPPIAP